MRILATLGLTILLTSCSSTMNNYYPQTVQSWQGGNVNQLVKSWGMPDDKMTSPNGHSVLVYRSHTTRTNSGPASPAIGVNFGTGGRPIITNTPSINTTWSRGGLTLSCLTLFEVNSKGTIVYTKSEGSGCFGNKSFADSKQNPGSQPR